jgi:carbon-monoxide dehydrogenase medium subunit
MLPSRFEYHRPASLDEALRALSSLEDAKVLAGGQSLIPVMKLRFAVPAHLVDINRIPGLDGIEDDGGGLRIGALVRHNQVAASEKVSARFPLLASAAPQIADPLVRNLGSVGGSLAHADPAGDWGAAMLAARATLVATGARGERTIAIDDFIVDTFTSTLEPDEILTEIRVPRAGPRSGGAYLKLERKVGDFAIAAAGVHLMLDGRGRTERAGIGLCNVGPTSLRAKRAEAVLVGQPPDDATIVKAAQAAGEECDPASDLRGPAEYKRDVIRVLTGRALRAAAQRAKGGA